MVSAGSSQRLSRRSFLKSVVGLGLTLGFGSAGSVLNKLLAASEAMRTRPIPSTGESLPVVGVGTAQQFDVPSRPEELRPLRAVLRNLFRVGGSLVDTSPMYGRSETVIGELLESAGNREQAFLATKVWTRGRENGIRQMRNSFSGLEELEAALENQELDFVQLPYSIGFRHAEERVLPLALDREVAVLVNRPFNDGPLFESVQGESLPGWAGDIGCETWAQFFLKFILGHPAVTCVIPGTSNPQHMLDNARAGTGPLPDSQQRRRMFRYWNSL